MAKPIAYQVVSFVPCYYTCMLGISGKYSRRGKVNTNYGRSYENQVKSFGLHLIDEFLKSDIILRRSE